VDNATLLQRWLDRVDEEAHKMNSANTFYEDMRSRGWRSIIIGKDSSSSKGGAGSSVNGDGLNNDDDESHFLNPQDDKGSMRIEPYRNPNG